MGFRFRKRSGLLGGLLHLNWSKQGLSSISIGAPGATVNIPVARSGSTRSTVGLPGTGLSYSQEGGGSRSVRERQQQQRPSVPSTEQIIADVMGAICGPENVGSALWGAGLVQMVLDHDDTPRRVREAALLIKSPEMVELHLRRARGKAATVAASNQIINAVKTVLAFTESEGWSTPGDS